MIRVALILAFSALVVVAAEPTSRAEKNKRIFRKTRDELVAEYENRVTELEHFHDLAKKGVVRLKQQNGVIPEKGREVYVFSSMREKNQAIDDLKQLSQQMRVKLEAIKGYEYIVPIILLDHGKVGDVGSLPDESLFIFQVINESAALVKHGEIFYLKIDTKGLVDKRPLRVDFPIEITGTTT